MIRIPISVALEREIRDPRWGAPVSAGELMAKLISLLDAERGKAANKSGPGIGYKDILGALRAGLGDRLAIPPNPSTAWIIRMVNRVREYGLNVEQIERAARRAGGVSKGAIEGEWVIQRSIRLLQDPEVQEVAGLGRIFTGRNDGDDNGGI